MHEYKKIILFKIFHQLYKEYIIIYFYIAP